MECKSLVSVEINTINSPSSNDRISDLQEEVSILQLKNAELEHKYAEQEGLV